MMEVNACMFDPPVTIPWTVRFEFTRIRCAEVRELCIKIELNAVNDSPTVSEFCTYIVPLVETEDRVVTACLKDMLD
jgi:hypothetical protein